MEENKYIYLDNAATTKPNDEVVVLFNKIENEIYGNPNSVHHMGAISSSYLEKARESLLKTFKLANHKVIFTSSSTEANNLAIKGYALAHKNRGNHLITTNVEHPSVLECFRQLEKEFGFEVTILKVNNQGVISLAELKNAIKDKTILVSIMAVNNEIGSVNDIKGIANIVHEHPKAVLHVDTTQAIGKVSLPYNDIDMFVLSGHKLHGIKGSGALLMRKSLTLLPLISGGGQEDNLRSGTQGVALACSLAKTAQLATKDMKTKEDYILELNRLLRDELSQIEGIEINSSELCSPYILNFSLKEKKAAVVVEALSNQGICVSSVSACHSKKEAFSYVVEAIGKTSQLFKNTIRVSFDTSNTKEEVLLLSCKLKEILRSIK